MRLEKVWHGGYEVNLIIYHAINNYLFIMNSYIKIKGRRVLRSTDTMKHGHTQDVTPEFQMTRQGQKFCVLQQNLSYRGRMSEGRVLHDTSLVKQ